MEASAVLSLVLNTGTQEFALVGSDTGTPADDGEGAGVADWAISSLGGSGEGDTTFNNGLAFSTDVGNPGFGLYDTFLESGDAFGGTVILSLGVSTSGTQTLTGTGTYQSYASLGAAPIARLEGAIGQSLILQSGSTGFGAINITAIPEFSHFPAALGALIMGLSFLFRLRARS